MKIWYLHYRTKEELFVEGEIVHGANNTSDRIVVKLSDGSHVDIIKSTIVKTRP
jgi:hypothetical protein